MVAILLVAAALLVQSTAQYSNVRYQPQHTQLSVQRDPDLYRVPDDAPQIGVPADSYEVPSYTYTATFNPEEVKNFDANTAATELPQEVNKEDGKARGIEVEKVEGAYYVLLPSSRLQRVQFVTENDRQNMAYTARLKYSSEAAPIFVYTAPQYPQAAYVEFKQP